MSSYTAIIRNGEIFTKRWDGAKQEYLEEKKTDQVLSDILQRPVSLEKTTFGQFFALIAKEKDLYEKVFKAALYGHPLGGFIEEIEKPAKACDGVDFVRVHWEGDIYENDLTLDAAFGGWGDWNAWSPGENDPKGGIAMEFTPLNEYKDLELRLDTQVQIFSLKEKGPVLSGMKEFTVYDVVNAILFEITWAGDPSTREKHPIAEIL